ncbi:MAG: preprotein translocase subunit SecE [Candidatus Nanopelagicales bacterium]
MSESSTTTGHGSSGGKKSTGQPGRWARLTLFMRQVIAELRKVIWPTRKELITYTWVVIVFVAVFAVIVGLYDWMFTFVVLRLFG